MPLPDTSVLIARHSQVRRALAAAGLDALVVTSSPNIRYLSNHVGSAGVFVLTPDAAHLLVDFGTRPPSRRCRPRVRPVRTVDMAGARQLRRGAPRLPRRDWSGDGWRGVGAPDPCAGRVAPCAVQCAEGGPDLPFHVEDGGAAARGQGRGGGGDAPRVGASARAGCPRRAAAVRTGSTERSIAAVIEAALRAAGFERAAFDTIVASGPNAALPHHRAG